MASGFLPLFTVLTFLLSVVVYRVLVVYYVPRRLRDQDAGIVEKETKTWWRIGAGLIFIISISALFIQLVLIHADLLSPIVDSIELGVIYAIMGIGLTLTYAVVKIPNFAYGEIVTLGAYVMALSNAMLRYPLPLAFVLAAASGAGLALLQHLLIYRPLIARGAKIVQLMIASFALSLMLRSVFWIISAVGNVSFYHPIVPNILRMTICGGDCRIGTAAITDLFVWVVPVTMVLIFVMHLLLTRTLVGKSMRAVADNIELSQVTGINVEYIRRITWLLTGALAGIGGGFLGIEYPITPELGWTSLLRVFAAVTIGGLVSFYGTVVGGIVVGFGENWVTIIGATNYGLSTSWQPFTAFIIIVIVLLIRPAGLSGITLRNPLAILNALRQSGHILLNRRRNQASPTASGS